MDDRWRDEVMKTLGRIEAGVNNNMAHTTSVSDKATRIDTKLDAHISSPSPHGEAQAGKTFDNMFKVIMAAIALGSFTWGIFKH